MVRMDVGDNQLLDVSEFDISCLRPLLESPQRFLGIPTAVDQDMSITAFDYIDVGRQ
jgi:hypothetical protein